MYLSRELNSHLPVNIFLRASVIDLSGNDYIPSMNHYLTTDSNIIFMLGFVVFAVFFNFGRHASQGHI